MLNSGSQGKLSTGDTVINKADMAFAFKEVTVKEGYRAVS